MPSAEKAGKVKLMQPIFQVLEEKINKFSGKSVHPATWALSFLGIIGLRMFIEFFIASPALSIGEITIEYLHNFFFFILAFLLIWLIASFFLQENPAHSALLMLWAAWLIVLPPIFDIIKTGGEVYWSFYVLNDIQALWSQFLTVFGRLPSGIVYFGTKITFILAIIFVTLLVWIKTRKWLKGLLAGFFTYATLFFMGSFPSFFTFGYYFLAGEKKVSQVNEIDIIQFLGTPARLFGTEFFNLKYSLAYNLNLIYYLFLLAMLILLFFKINSVKFLAVIKNSRFPQLVYHAGLFFIGLGLGYLIYPENFHLYVFSAAALLVLMSSIWLAWLASVVFNDIYDFQIDEISNPQRPLQKKIFTVQEYESFGVVVFLLSLLGGLTISFKFAALIFIYQLIAWVYSVPPFRLKRFPLIATLASSVASLVVLFIGFTLFSGDQNIHGLSWRIILLIIIALTLSLPIKDFKDIAGDEKYGVLTIPVIFGEEKGRLIVATSAFLSFMLSVFLLNELRLFWWALLFGGAAFLIITSKKIKPQLLFWWVLSVVGAYGLILMKTVFI